MQSTLDRLAEWIATRPWYSRGPGGSPDDTPRLTELAEFFLPSPDPSARVRVLLVRDDAPAEPVLYQVPVVERDVLPAPDARGLIGAGYGGATLFDGVADPAFAAALLAGIHEAGHLRDVADDRMIVESLLVADGTTPVLRLTPYGRPPLEVWLFRRVLDGPHPDVVAAEALADAGADSASRLAGVLPVRWLESGAERTAHLAVVREVPGDATDGWHYAASAARAGRDADARALGRTLALTHRALAAAQPARPASADERSATLDSWRTRLAGAAREVPAVADLTADLELLLDRAETMVDWPALQTVHGALELALTSRRDTGEWVLRSFGGTDPVPADDRADLAVRDLAGLLRSLHYAGGLTGAGSDWVTAQRRQLLDGYASVAGDAAIPAALLDAIEADYAIVDAVWEARVRPESLSVPVEALRRLVRSRLGDELAA